MPRDVPEPVASKFVVRKLPPELTEDAFKAVLQNVCQDELEWFRYHPGSTGESGITTSTAFIKLRHAELAPILKQLLQNSPFIGDHGVPYHCEMEVAFYQRTPKERAKEDPYVGTYEQDPYYKDFLKEIERQDEAAKKGPTITATTTIAENPADKEPIVTPLMSYVINRYKSGSGRSRNGKGPSGDGREKENRKKLPAIPEKPAAGKSAPPDAPTTGKSAPAKRGRGSKREEKNVKGKAGPSEATNTAQHQDKQQESSQTGKSGRGKGPKGQSRAATNGGSSGGGAAGQPAVPPSTTGAEDSPVVASSADVDAARSAAQAAARVAMQLASDTAGPLSAVGQPEGGAAKNGSAAAPSKAAPKRPRCGRRARGRGGAGGQDAEGAGGDAQGGSQSAAVPAAEQRVTSASERAIAAAAAAASAALQDSAPGERPKPRTRPAFGARGVRDALSRAGIKQPASATTGKQGKQKGGGGGGGAAAGAPAGDGREGSSGP